LNFVRPNDLELVHKALLGRKVKIFVQYWQSRKLVYSAG
jgi:hypothetical protein